MNKLTRLSSRLKIPVSFVGGVVICLALMLASNLSVAEQSRQGNSRLTNDMSPPIISHEPITGTFDYHVPLVIKATVKDAAGIQEVILFYRSPDNLEYRFVSMHLDDVTKNSYSATIPSDMVIAPRLDYYLHAMDNNGNSATRGGGLFPLTVAIGNLGTNTTAEAETGKPEFVLKENNNNIYYWTLGGAVAAVILAGAYKRNQDDEGESAAKPIESTLVIEDAPGVTR